MPRVNAWIDGLDGFVDVRTVDVTAKDVVAHVKGNLLTIVEGILDDDDGSAYCFLYRGRICFCIFVFVLWFWHTDGELLVALAANEDETLTWLVACLVEYCIAVALGATNLLH